MAELKQKAQEKAGKNVVKSNKNVITASVVSGVIGSVTTLLLAPKSGKDLRTDISGKVTSAKNKTDQFSKSTKSKLSDLKMNTSEKSKRFAEKFKHNGNDEFEDEDDEDESELYSDEMEETRQVKDNGDAKENESIENDKGSKVSAKKPATKKKAVADKSNSESKGSKSKAATTTKSSVAATK